MNDNYWRVEDDQAIQYTLTLYCVYSEHIIHLLVLYLDKDGALRLATDVVSVNTTPIGFGYVEAENALPVLDEKLFIVLPPVLDKASDD